MNDTRRCVERIARKGSTIVQMGIKRECIKSKNEMRVVGEL